MNLRDVALTLAVFLMGAWIPSPAGAGSQGRGHGAKAKHEAQHSIYQHPAKHSEAGYQHVKGGPPPWAPAHGYRRKHGAGVKYVAPFGIDIGTCDRSVLGAALGGAAGGLLASELARGDDRTAAIVGGTLLGILVGGAIGDSMDTVDHGCFGQVLEHSPPRETVRWNNPDRRAAYEVTPTETYREEDGRYCREYQTTIAIDGELERAHGTACRQPDGSWQRAG